MIAGSEGTSDCTPVVLLARAASICLPVARAGKSQAEQTVASGAFVAPHAKQCQAYGALMLRLP